MNSRVLKEIKAHAIETPRVEVCGLVVDINGKFKVVRGKNIALEPEARFTLSPESFMEAEEAGKIVAIYHSHPYSGCAPSPADKAACEASKLTWLIYSLGQDQFSTLEPTGEISPLLGRQFVWGVFDCYTLVRDYFAEKLQVAFPIADPYEEYFWKNQKNYYVERYEKFGFKLVPLFEEVREHDVFLIHCLAPVPNHAAIYVGGGMILHHAPQRLSCRDVFGGYWRDNAVFQLRHESLC